jgi:hypothetical protein
VSGGAYVCIPPMSPTLTGIIYSIFHRFDLEWDTAPSRFVHRQLDITLTQKIIDK